MTLQVSVHNYCRWSGADRFHIRVRLDDSMVAAFMAKVVKGAESYDHEYFNVGGYFTHNGKRFYLTDGEFNDGAVIGPKISDISFVGLRVDDITVGLTPFQGGWNVDFSLEKVYGDDRDVDHTRWLNTGVENDLPECFWIEPAAIIRAIIQH